VGVDLQEPLRPQVLVAPLVARRDAGGVEDGVHRERAARATDLDASGVDRDRACDLRAADTDPVEGGRRSAGVDDPGAGENPGARGVGGHEGRS
jgi:hypothetical protein